MSVAWKDDSQYATGGTIKLTDKVAVYDYQKYTDRMYGIGGASPNMKEFRTNGVDWDWPGNAGHSRINSDTPRPFNRLPRLTKDSEERLGYKNIGETINVEAALWTGEDFIWKRGKFQAVKFTFNGKAAFAWVVYNSKVYFGQAESESDRIRHEITDDELINGFTPDYGKKYELIFPAIKVIINIKEGEYSTADKYTLIGYNQNNQAAYERTQTVGNDAIDNGGIKELVFLGTPRKLLYTLKCEDGPDRNGKKSGVYDIFTNKPYA